jgi:PAS domain S-box
MQQMSHLLVPDAFKDPEWEHNPAISLGLAYYLGFPLIWPDGELFGTFCIFDRSDNRQATKFVSLVAELRELIERDLQTIIVTDKYKNLLKKFRHHRNHLREMVSGQIAELEKNKEILEERVGFENLAAAISASFVNIPPERLDDAIASALTNICRFFGVDHCGLFEVLTDHRQIHLINIDEQGIRQKELLTLDIAFSAHPLAYHWLVEEEEPLIFPVPETLSREARGDPATWKQAGLRAILILPLRVGGQVTHLIGLFNHGIIHDWSVFPIPRLRFLGEIFAGTVLHSHAHERLLRSEQRLADAQRIAHLGSWDWDITAGELQWSDEVYRIFGLEPQAFGETYEAFLASVHPDDRQLVKEAVDQSLADPGKIYSIKHRVVLPDGGERVVHERGEVLFDRDRNPVRMVGTCHDITEQKRAEEALQKAFDEIKSLKEQLEAENIYLREEMRLKEKVPERVGASDAIKYVLYRIGQVAHTRITVLLTGETGSGKNLFARYIHEKSDRRDKPFVNVNCAVLPPNLIESELFGREKGAFTGSTARQIGRFELANNGTIFLDEIGELSLELQAKLLKVIENGEFERLGNPNPVKVDVRIIASSNRNLEEEIKKGGFRKDLFYRLNVFPLTIPPLRERKGDITLLVKFYCETFSKIYHKGITKIPKDIMKTLENYDWPGNVRELINVVERAIITSDGPALRLAGQISPLPVGSVQEKVSDDTKPRQTKSLVKVEREHIRRALKETGWKIEGPKGTAQLLGINPSTLRARMRKLGIRRPGND